MCGVCVCVCGGGGLHLVTMQKAMATRQVIPSFTACLVHGSMHQHKPRGATVTKTLPKSFLLAAS